MPFKLEVLRGATAYTISDGAPFSIDEADLGGAAVRNIDQSGPFQDGSTHLGHRLASNVMTLRLFVKATSHTVLDGYRDTLNKIFQPVDGIPCILKLTRDDGTIRQLDTWREGFLAIPLDKTTRPGFTHKAVVQLRASDPAWYNPTEQSASFVPPTGDWWLGFATIGSANVLTHVENPTQGQLFAHTGSVAAGSAWTVAFRSSFGTPTVAPWKYAFDVHPPSGEETNYRIFAEGPGAIIASGTVGILGPTMEAGTSNYFVVMQGTALSYYIGASLYSTEPGTTRELAGSAAGSARWRSNYLNDVSSRFPVALPQAAVYNIALNPAQIASLDGAMQGTALGGSAYAVNVVYTGDLDTRPVITLKGPIANPIITNTTTGDVLNFTGGTVGSVDTWIVDTRYGRKSALLGTTSVANYLSTDSDLATFRIVPDPITAGGTNTITVQSTDAGTAAVITVAYYTRYLSY